MESLRVNVARTPGALVALAITFALSLAPAVALADAPGATLKAVRTSKPPVIDGRLDEGEWQGAAVATGFVQYQPRRGESSAVRTEVLVLYDEGHLYVGVRAWDPEPLTARLTQRDADLFEDDSVVVLLDSFNDRRTAYYFMTNPLGTQADGRIADDGRSSDGSWDAAWQSAARISDIGWTAEIAIPLSSIKFKAGEDQTWGINFGRSRRRTLELSSWTGPLDAWPRVSQSGALAGLNVPPPIDRIQIVPYGLSRLQQRERPDWQAGLDVRYALTPTMAAYGTLYPDFATIEADQEQINLTRFEVSLREKRQFFLEGQELFGQRIRTFYSRRIADIAAGGKLLGKQGPWNVAFLQVASDPTDSSPRAAYTVGRLQRDVGGRSNVAVMATNRNLSSVNQGSVSMDANLFFTKTLGMTAQLVESWGRYGQGSEGFFVRPAYDSPTSHFHVRYTHLGDRLADNLNPTGQIKDDDRREVDSAFEKTLWIRSGALEQVVYESNYNIYWSQKNVLRSWQVDEGVEFEFRNRWNLQLGHTEEFKRFEKDFRNRRSSVEVGYNTREYQSVSVGFETGRNFDADFQLWTSSARYKVTQALSAEYSLERLVLDPDPEHESTWIHVIRANQFFTKDLYLKTFFQTNSSIDRENFQAVFVYRYRPPFGTIQVAYQRGTAAFGQRSEQGHTLFLKVTTVF